jgi:hypothetical protein
MAVTNNPQAQPLQDGEVKPQNIDLDIVTLVLRPTSCSSVDHSNITWHTALKPTMDFCQRGLGAGAFFFR